MARKRKRKCRKVRRPDAACVLIGRSVIYHFFAGNRRHLTRWTNEELKATILLGERAAWEVGRMILAKTGIETRIRRL